MKSGVFLVMCCLWMVGDHLEAGAKVKINDSAHFDLGMRLQSLYINSEKLLDDDGDPDRHDSFRLRRARLRLKAFIGNDFEAFLQTELGSFGTDGNGGDWRVIDGWIRYQWNEDFSVYAGLHKVPTTRQTLTSSGALMAIDRTGLVSKELTWGIRAQNAFNTATYAPSDSKLRSGAGVRDLGVTFYWTRSFSDRFHAKLYAALNDGIQAANSDNERYSYRGQVNFFDAEKGYFHQTNYRGKKKIISLAIGGDWQNSVAMNAQGAPVDYCFHTADLHVEWPVAANSVSFESGYLAVDLGDEEAMMVGAATIDTRKTAGEGYYVQAGYNLGPWQPFVLYDQWDADALDGTGSFDSLRLGLVYYFIGNTANIKVGHEQFSSDRPFLGEASDMDTWVVGLYLTY
jgi:hypothetical protein